MSRSGVWVYFEKIDNKIAVCNICKQTYSYKTTVTNLKRHLKVKHFSAFVTLTASTVTTKQEYCETTIRSAGTPSPTADFEDASTPESPTYEEEKPATSWITLVPAPPRSPSPETEKPISSFAKKQSINKALLNMFTKDFHPFSLVEEEGFVELIHKINPNVDLPSRKYISSTLIPVAYKKKINSVRDDLSVHAQRVCLTTDCWTSRSTEFFLAVTAHYLKEDGGQLEIKSVLLDCERFGESHTSEDLAQALIEIVDKWNLQGKVTFVVTDNAANIKGAIDLIDWPHFNCYVGSLNIVVERSLQPYNNLINKIKEIVSRFHKSPTAAELLLRHQTDQGITQPLSLKKCITTRWNSVFCTVERLADLQKAVQSVMSELHIDITITAEEWEHIKELVKILKPFEEVTAKMSGEKYLTASMAIVLTSGVKFVCDQLKRDVVYNVSKELLDDLRKGLEDQYEKLEFKTELALCTFMDPRFKNFGFSDSTALTNIKEHIINMISREITAQAISEPITNPAAASPSSNKSSKYSVWTLIQNSLENFSQPEAALSKATKEVNMFLSEKMLDREQCQLEWWNIHKSVYPNMYQVFKKNCHVVATCVPCDRVFSKAGCIISERRSRLVSKRASELIFLNANM